MTFNGSSGVSLGATLTGQSIEFYKNVTIASSSVLRADILTLDRSVLGSSLLSIIPNTNGSAMTLASSGGSLNYGSTAFSSFTGDLWLGALSTASTAVSGHINFDAALNTGGNLYVIAGKSVVVTNKISTPGKVIIVAESGSITGSGSGTHISSGGSLQLGASSNVGTAIQRLNVSGTSAQVWQGDVTLYLGYSGAIDNRPGNIVLQFISTAAGANAWSNSVYAGQTMKEQVIVSNVSVGNTTGPSSIISSCTTKHSQSSAGFSHLSRQMQCFVLDSGQRECVVMSESENSGSCSDK